MSQIMGVGPLDALKAKNIANQALKDAQSSRLPGLHNGPADAYRHCVWSCEMTKELGAVQAKKIGDTHEAYGNGPSAENYMDYYNNALGRVMGGKSESCQSSCNNLATRNILQTDVNKPKKSVKSKW